jgi:hypothetical protein
MLGDDVSTSEVVDPDEIVLAALGKGEVVRVNQDHRDIGIGEHPDQAPVDQVEGRTVFQRLKEDAGYAIVDIATCNVDDHAGSILAPLVAAAPEEGEVLLFGACRDLRTDRFKNFPFSESRHQKTEEAIASGSGRWSFHVAPRPGPARDKSLALQRVEGTGHGWTGHPELGGKLGLRREPITPPIGAAYHHPAKLLVRSLILEGSVSRYLAHGGPPCATRRKFL